MNLLVTGGCGFIGSNFIRQRLTEPGSPLRRLVNLDALTYAGNPANLADLAGDPRLCFCTWRHRRPGAGGPAAERASDRCDRELRRRVARRSVDRFARAVCADECSRDAPAVEQRPAALGEIARARKNGVSLSPRFHRRSLRHARAGRSRFHGRHAVCAEQSLRGFQGGERPPRASLPAYLWAADTHDELLEQLRPLSFCRRNSFPW